MTLMLPSLRPYDVLLRAVHSATSELELGDIRALIAHHAGGALEEIDGVIATRRRALAAQDQRPPRDGRDGRSSAPSDIPSWAQPSCRRPVHRRAIPGHSFTRLQQETPRQDDRMNRINRVRAVRRSK